MTLPHRVTGEGPWELAPGCSPFFVSLPFARPHWRAS